MYCPECNIATTEQPNSISYKSTSKGDCLLICAADTALFSPFNQNKYSPVEMYNKSHFPGDSPRGNDFPRQYRYREREEKNGAGAGMCREALKGEFKCYTSGDFLSSVQLQMH